MRELLEVKVGGEYACFTRPEFKVERVSYLVMTPSAARGVLEAVFWKPEIRYQIREIVVLKPLKQFAILRNELSDRQGGKPVFVEQQRQQRTSLVLKDVAYIIRAELLRRPHNAEPLRKYVEQFQRRVERGQCCYTPSLGTREFAAWFESPQSDEEGIALDIDLGPMLFDIAYCEDAGRQELEFLRHGASGARKVKGYAKALSFNAMLGGGTMAVPEEKYRELYRLEG